MKVRLNRTFLVVVVLAALVAVFVGAASSQSTNNPQKGNNRLPTIAATYPSSITAGSPGLTLYVTGQNFVRNSVVRWNNSDRPTTYIDSTTLRASITATDIDICRGGIAQVTVFNPSTAGGTSNSLTFTINNPFPNLTQLSPQFALAGQSGFTLQVSGGGFVCSSIVRWNGSDRPTTFVNSTTLRAAIPASDLSVGGFARVTVFSPAPGGGDGGANFFVKPQITSLSPNPVFAGSGSFQLVVAGAGFDSGSVVQWNGVNQPTTFISSTQLIATIGEQLIAQAGTPTIGVVSPQASSTTAVLNVVNTVPQVTALSPSVVPAGSAPVLLTVSGQYFVSSTSIRWNGSDRPTTFLSNTQLQAQISANDLTTPGDIAVTAFNPAPGGGQSQPLTFKIGPANNPSPVITSLSDVEAPVGWPAFRLVVHGNGFVGASSLHWNGVSRPTTVVNSSELRVLISANDLASAGIAQLSVSNPLPGGGISNQVSFRITSVATNAVGVIEQSSINTQFEPGNADTTDGQLSANGRFVVLSSDASNLVPNDRNEVADVFLRDTCIGAPVGCVPSVMRVSLDNAGGEFSIPSYRPLTSATGRFVAFSNQNANGYFTTYVRDTCITGPAGCLPNTLAVATNGIPETMSADGRFLAQATYDCYFDYQFVCDSYVQVFDTCLGTTTPCQPGSFSNFYNVGGGAIANPTMSGTGRFVAYTEDGGLALWDTCLGAPFCSPIIWPILWPNVPHASDIAITRDGRYLVFSSSNNNLVANDTNGQPDVFLFDTCFGGPDGCRSTTIRVSLADEGFESNGASSSPSVSDDARFVAFSSAASNLVPSDTNNTADVFVRDTCIGAPSGCVPHTWRVSVALLGTQGDDSSFSPRITADGRYLSFISRSTRLVPGDTNIKQDVFVARTGRP
jgi:trimeric autotransporter adhesin